MEWVATTIASIINAGTRIYAAALIASTCLLFLPSTLISQLGLDTFKASYRAQAGIVLIVSGSLLLTSIASNFWSSLFAPFRKWQARRNLFETLSELTFAEKAFITPFIRDGENTRYADFHDGVSKGLEAKGILYRSSSVSAPGGVFPYNMQPGARKLLSSKPQLLHV